MSKASQRSQWRDPNESNQFAKVVKKVATEPDRKEDKKETSPFQLKKREEYSVEQLVDGVLQGDRSILGRAITLIESNAEQHFHKSQQLLQKLLPYTGKAIRIGITGVPGAGKSTFIESFGSYLCSLGLNVAVLAVDPSSTVTGGSILGDKTRMEKLSRNQRAFIRPSPSEGKLGGVHRKTRESMAVCEAAGFDVILVETVGVGQSEVHVRDMVDIFILLVITGAGDELQGMKRGMMELVDMIIVNKADGDNLPHAIKTKEEYNQILHFLKPATKGWATKAYTCSSINGDGLEEIWEEICKFEQKTKESGVFAQRRREQLKKWMYEMIRDQLEVDFFTNLAVKELLPIYENEIISGNKTVASSVHDLLSVYYRSKGNHP